MKLLAPFLFISLFANICSAQLKFKPQNFIDSNDKGVGEFLATNRFDYAVIAWSTSNWLPLTYRFSGLVRHDKRWYLLHIYSKTFREADKLYRHGDSLIVNQLQIPAGAADSLLRAMNLPATFKVQQAALDSLRGGCKITSTDGTVRSIGIFDSWNLHIAEAEKSKVRTLNAYAPDYFLEKCAPYNSNYKVLEGLLNACQQVFKTMASHNKLLIPELER